MKVKHLVAVFALSALVLAPLGAQEQPGEADDETALDAIAEHEETSAAYDLFAEAFADVLDGETNLALFAPADDALDGIEAADLSPEELQELFNSHVAFGIASHEPIEFIEWFATADETEVDVEQEDDEVVLNGEVEIEDAIAVENGIVYVVSDSLD